MDKHEKLHLIVALLIFINMFTFLMLPPPLTQLSKIFHSFGTVSFKVANALGIASENNICNLADLWNLQGIEMEVLEVSGNVNNYSCGVMSEYNISITNPEKEKYGEYLFGEVQNIYILDNITLNKLFFASFIMLGLWTASLFTDFFLFLWPKKPTNALIMGTLVVMTIASQLLLVRVGPLFPAILAGAKALPGSTMIADGLYLMLSMGLFWFLYSQVAQGYNQAKKSKDLFTGLKLNAEVQKNRAMKYNEAVKRKLQEK